MDKNKGEVAIITFFGLLARKNVFCLYYRHGPHTVCYDKIHVGLNIFAQTFIYKNKSYKEVNA